MFCARYFEKLITREGPENIGGIILEPVIGAAAAGVTPPEEYYRIIREICDKYEILMIADEVITGFGRTGENFGFHHFGFTPDIVSFGKGISSGFGPLAGIIVRESIYKEMTEKGMDFGTGHTYGGNPLSAVAGVAVLSYIKKHEIVGKARERGDRLSALLKDMKERVPGIADVRGLGLLWGVELCRPGTEREPFPKEEQITKKVWTKPWRTA